ncbi:hypothetical protein ACWGI0_23200 [Streptomyces sp. NPDC054802]
MTTITLPPGVLSAHREQLAAWIKANGIDPAEVPLTHPLRGEAGEGQARATHHRGFIRTPDGRTQFAEGGTVVRTEQRTAPCTVPLPTLPPPLAAPHGEHRTPTPTLRPASAT